MGGDGLMEWRPFRWSTTCTQYIQGVASGTPPQRELVFAVGRPLASAGTRARCGDDGTAQATVYGSLQQGVQQPPTHKKYLLPGKQRCSV